MRDWGTEETSEENGWFLSLMKETKVQSERAPRTLSRINTRKVLKQGAKMEKGSPHEDL
jgi:hypothetical protein